MKTTLRQRFEMWRLKRRAKRAYMQYMAISDSYPCGTSLTNFLSLRAAAEAKRFDETYARIRQLDPTAPEEPRLQIDLNVRSQLSNG